MPDFGDFASIKTHAHTGHCSTKGATMPPPPTTTAASALLSLLTEINDKKEGLAVTSEKACELPDAELGEVVRHCIQTDALLTVAQAIVLASLNTAPAVQS